MGNDQTPALRGTGLTKRYGKVTALTDVDIEVWPGEVVALVGDNGAGKSTLVKMLSGVTRPSDGHIEIGGARVTLTSPRDARGLGLETVFQDLGLAADLSIVENVFLGREVMRPGIRGRLGMVDRRAMAERAISATADLRISLPRMEQRADQLSGGQRQAVAVARALTFKSRAILLDEPTAALAVEETNRIHELIGELRAAHIAVLIVSHDLPAVMEVSDRIVVLRNGKLVDSLITRDVDINVVIARITGHKMAEAVPAHGVEPSYTEKVTR